MRVHSHPKLHGLQRDCCTLWITQVTLSEQILRGAASSLCLRNQKTTLKLIFSPPVEGETLNVRLVKYQAIECPAEGVQRALTVGQNNAESHMRNEL